MTFLRFLFVLKRVMIVQEDLTLNVRRGNSAVYSARNYYSNVKFNRVIDRYGWRVEMGI